MVTETKTYNYFCCGGWCAPRESNSSRTVFPTRCQPIRSIFSNSFAIRSHELEAEIIDRGYTRDRRNYIRTRQSKKPLPSCMLFQTLTVISGRRRKAFTSARDGSKLSIIELKKFCSENLPLYMVPDLFCSLESLPKTSTDKIDYQKLKTM